jgi:uncharacterized membrane protein HdeD (DUF308 family)
MNRMQKIRSFLMGLGMIACAAVMLAYPADGLYAVMLFLGGSLFLRGIRKVIYFFTMARFMVGGSSLLYRGMVQADCGLFFVVLADIPRIYAMVYLLAGYAFSGLRKIYGALSARRMGSTAWRLRLFWGVFHVLIFAVCLFLLSSVKALVAVYCIGLISSGIMHITDTFRRTAIVYIR